MALPNMFSRDYLDFCQRTAKGSREKKCGMTYENKVKVYGQGHPNGHSATNLRHPQGAECIMLGTVNTLDLAPVLGTQVSK